MKVPSILLLLLLVACDRSTGPSDPVPARIVYWKDSNVQMADVLGTKYDWFNRWGVSGPFRPTGLEFVYYKHDRDYARDLDSIGLVLVDAFSGSEIYLTTIRVGVGANWNDAEWSHDGKLIIYSAPRRGHNDDICLFDLETMKEKRLTSTGTNILPHLSRDGLWISCLSGMPDDSLYRIRIINTYDTTSHIIALDGFPTISARWLPDGRILTMLKSYGALNDGIQGDIVVLNRDGSGLTYLTQDHQTLLADLYNENSVIVVAKTQSGYNSIEMMDIQSKQRSILAVVDGTILTSPSLSPDSKYLGFTSQDSTGLFGFFVTELAVWQPKKIDQALSPIVFSISRSL